MDFLFNRRRKREQDSIKIPVRDAISKDNYRRNLVFVSVSVEGPREKISEGGILNPVISPKVSFIPITNNMNCVREKKICL